MTTSRPPDTDREVLMSPSELFRIGACALPIAAVVLSGCADAEPQSQSDHYTEADDRSLCLASGGEWFGSEADGGCACGPYGLPGTFIPAEGGCVDGSVGQALCEESGGTWTDDSADAWYCICSNGSDPSFRTGKCETTDDAVADYLSDGGDELPSAFGLIHPQLGVRVIHAPGAIKTVDDPADLESVLASLLRIQEALQ